MMEKILRLEICSIYAFLQAYELMYAYMGPVINSSRGGDGRHLGGRTRILHAQREGD